MESPDLPVDRDCWSLAASGAVGAELRSGCSRPSGFRESGTPWSNYRAAIVERWPQSGFNLLSCLSPEGRGAGSSLECGGQGLPRPSQAPCGEGSGRVGCSHKTPPRVYLGVTLVAMWLPWLWILPTCLSARLAAALHSCCTWTQNLGQAGAGRQGELPGQCLLTPALSGLLHLHTGLWRTDPGQTPSFGA